jgi:hypothetical protein
MHESLGAGKSKEAVSIAVGHVTSGNAEQQAAPGPAGFKEWTRTSIVTSISRILREKY